MIWFHLILSHTSMGYLKDSSKMELEKIDMLNRLFSLYEALLTEKQSTYFKMYYYEDYTLQEIAESLNVSRNAIFDQLKIVSAKLFDFEAKLHLLETQKQRKKYLDSYEKTKDTKYLDLLRKMDE